MVILIMLREKLPKRSMTKNYQKEALWQLSDNSFYQKVDKFFTSINHNTVKNTINKQEMPASAKISS